MIDGMKFYEKSKLKDGDFVKVKGNQLKFYEYTLAGEVNLDCDTEKAFRFDNWSITLELTISLVDYTKVVEKAVDNHYKVDEYTLNLISTIVKKFILSLIRNFIKRQFTIRLIAIKSMSLPMIKKANFQKKNL
ncbi:hypothetical protein [Streptococcus thermophilus]|uniref:hypothetical protein n=1 Tax=Streptococcus thermophilus TaxID=1308 RepID=UPI003A7F8356